MPVLWASRFTWSGVHAPVACGLTRVSRSAIFATSYGTPSAGTAVRRRRDRRRRSGTARGRPLLVRRASCRSRTVPRDALRCCRTARRHRRRHASLHVELPAAVARSPYARGAGGIRVFAASLVHAALIRQRPRSGGPRRRRAPRGCDLARRGGLRSASPSPPPDRLAGRSCRPAHCSVPAVPAFRRDFSRTAGPGERPSRTQSTRCHRELPGGLDALGQR